MSDRSRWRTRLLVLSMVVLLPSCSATGQQSSSGTSERTRSAARAFLERYVEPDGRVVRRDQGGDTVSEGVSYALLLAQVAEDPVAERRIWAWAQEHLRRPDGLLSYLADAQGDVLDDEVATDGDLVVAWALSRSRQPELRDEAGPLLAAVRKRTVVFRPPGPLLAAGPWATGEPATLNPSYWVLPALRAVGWDDLAAPVGPALDAVGADGLPPDWARQDGSRLSAGPDPSGRFPQAQYGLDAQRVTVWLAADCDPANRVRAAGHRPLLQEGPAASARSLTGEVLDPTRHPLGLVAAAAAADADGDRAARDELLDDAAAQDQRSPTYYGAAWVALGRALLQDDVLDPCEDEA